MAKELIRNGGFERGNLDFWVCEAGNAEVVSDVKIRGNYSAKLVVGNAGYALLSTNDWIDIRSYEVYRALIWLKSVSWHVVKCYIKLYDSDYNYISGEDVSVATVPESFDWSKYDVFFAIPLEASFMKLCINAEDTDGDYGYIDSVSLQNISPDRVAVYPMELANISNWTTTGTFYVASKFSGLWKYADCYLDVSALSGSSPTLDVVIQAYDPVTGEWADIVVFDQATSSGSQLKVATAGLGWKVRVKYTTGGTITDCDFKVSAIFKR